MFEFFMAICVCSLHVSMAVPVETRNDYVTSVVLMLDGATGGTTETSMPDLLPFGLHLNGERLVLKLHRLETLQALTSQPTGDDRTAQNILDAAVYKDASLSAVMCVKRFASRFYLDGTFMYDGLVWAVKPLEESSHQATNDNSVNKTDTNDNSVKHRIFVPSWLNSPLNFRGDKLNLSNGQPKGSSHRNSPRNSFHSHETQHPRHKRGVTHHVVEIAFIVDYADYIKWERSHGAAKALSEMRLWYTYVAETINMRYVSIVDPDFKIRTTICVLKILTKAHHEEFVQMFNVNGVFNANTGLERFVVWHQKQEDIPPSDHYMLFTGMDVEEFTGRAYMSSACTPFGVSIIKSSVDGLVGLIAAHELGHSLSASHDANTDSCRDDDQYVMSTVSSSSVDPSNEGNPWRFSPCSVKAFKTYLQITDCTLPEKTKQSNLLPSGPSPGQVLTKDEQCARSSRDSGSHYCKDVQEMNGGEHQVCSGMFCSSVDEPTLCYVTLPLEHTACGDNMWCYSGHCVSNLSIQVTSQPEVAATPDVTLNTSLVPPDGTASPPDGTASPPDGTASPPDGTASPPDGTASPFDGTASPPDGTASPPDGTAPSADKTANPTTANPTTTNPTTTNPTTTNPTTANPTTANPTTTNPTTTNPTTANPSPTKPKETISTKHDPDRPTTETKLKNQPDTNTTCSLEMQQIQHLTSNNSMNVTSISVSYSSAEQSNNNMTRQQTDYSLKLQQQHTSTDKTGSATTNSQIFQFSFRNQFYQSNEPQSLTLQSVQSMQPTPGSTQQNVQPVNLVTPPIHDSSLGQASNIQHESNPHQPALHLTQPDHILQALQSQLSNFQMQPDNPFKQQPDNLFKLQPNNPLKSNIFGSIHMDGCAVFIYLGNLDGWMSCKNLIKTPEIEVRSGQLLQ